MILRTGSLVTFKVAFSLSLNALFREWIFKREHSIGTMTNCLSKVVENGKFFIRTFRNIRDLLTDVRDFLFFAGKSIGKKF
jgi:hypothetical protein